MYLILKHAIKTPMFKEIIAEYDYTVPKTNKSAARNIYNRNPLVNSYSDYYYKYSVGGITGSTQQSGECLASVAQKDGYTYICIAMKGSYERINGSTDKFNTSFVASKKMYQWAFENMKLKIVSDTSRIVDEIKVRSAEDADYVSLVPEKEITALVPLSAQTEGLSIVTDITTKPESVAAPVRKGQIIAQADIYYSKTVIARVNLVALNDVQRSEKEAIVFALKDFFASKPFFVVLIIFTAGIFVFVASAYTEKKETGEEAGG